MTRPGKHAEGEVVHGVQTAVLLGQVLDVDAGHGPSLAAFARSAPSRGWRSSPPLGVAPRGWLDDGAMARFLRPLFLGTTDTRLLHLWVPMLCVSVWLFIDMSRPAGCPRCC